ncbi:MAG: glycolate oxidase subunit GlcE [Endozoicomonas sp.]
MPDISHKIIDQVLTIRQDQSALNIIGGDSKSFLGRTPAGSPLHLREHTGIVDYQPEELVITARAGTTLQEVEQTLSVQGQILACEPPLFDGKATIGGTLACNLSGPARPWAGSIRDHVLGLRLINGKGEHLRFGGQVMKNVAGYDVSRLQAGAMGTLGVIAEVSLKVMPGPAATLTLAKQADAEEAIHAMNKHSAEAAPLAGACWSEGIMYLRLAGAQSAVEKTAEQWSGDVLDNNASIWRDLREQQLSFFLDDKPLWRFSIRSSAAHFLTDGDWLIDWAGSQRWLRGHYSRMELDKLAEDAGGTVSIFHGGDRQGEVFHQPAPGLIALQKRIKASFDPDGLFNPGRLYSWM